MGTPSQSPGAPVEKQRLVRYEIDARFEIVHAGGRATCPTEDLGAGGCRITVGLPLEKGTVVSVRLTSPASDLAAAGPATVAWASRTEPYQVGLQFSDEVAEQAIEFIQSVLGGVAIHTGAR